MKKSRAKIFQSNGKLVTVVYIIAQIITGITIIGAILTTILDSTRTVPKMLEHIMLCILALLLMNLPWFTQQKYKIKIPDFMLIIITSFIVAHFIFGEIYRAYDYILLYDKILHSISGAIIAIGGFALINYLNERHHESVKLSPGFIAMFAFCFTLSLGVIWELFEYATDTLVGSNMQRWQDDMITIEIQGEEQKAILGYKRPNGLEDTMQDLLVSTIGAVVICSLGYTWLKKGNPKINNFFVKRQEDNK